MSESTSYPAEEKELIFVYNARSGLFNKVTDFAHKVFSPDTYDCQLCTLTHGHLGPYQEWVDFVQELPFKVSFQYKTEWREFRTFPLVLVKSGKDIEVLIDTGQLRTVDSLEKLMGLLRDKLLLNS